MLYHHKRIKKMKNGVLRLVVSAMAFLISCAAYPAPVTLQQARANAQSFLSAKGKRVAQRMRVNAKTATDSFDDMAAYYVFNVEEGGFVVVSGNDVTAPVLGFCDKGFFDADRLPDGLQWLLQMYEDQIQSLNKAAYTSLSAEMRKSKSVYHNIEPIMTTLWNQGNPYNLLCPRYFNPDGSQGDLCATGCVATAIAQVMAFYKYPNATVRTIPGYVQHFDTDKGDKSVQLRNVPSQSVIDWDNMLDVYDGSETDVQQQAVAQLMYWVGLGCKMGYGPSSAAGFPSAVDALVRYFGYDDGTHIESRYRHSLQSWIDLLYNELASGHPIAFAGTNTGGAHAFVIDGYDVDGLFHVNWGWGGMDNGYFRIDVLDPNDQTGIGASPVPGGYNMGQDAIIGMRLPDEVTAEAEGYKLTVNDWEIRNGNTFFANYVNWSGVDGDWNIGIGRVEDDGTLSLLGHYQTVNLGQNYYLSCEFVVRGLEEGSHRLVPVSKRTVDKKWQTHVNPAIRYVQADVEADGKVSLTIHPIEDVELTGISFPGNHKRGDSQQVCATFRNHGEEYYHEVFLFAGLGNKMGSSVCRTAVNVCEDGESTASFSFQPQESGIWTVWLASDNEGKDVLGHATVEITERGIPRTDNLRFVSVTVSNRSNGAVYGNCTQGKVTILNQGNEDYDGNVQLWLFKLAGNGYFYGHQKMYAHVYIPAKKTAQANFFFDNLQLDATYNMSIGYEDGGDIEDGGLKAIGRTQKGIVCWLADNTLKGMPPASLVNAPSNALAVDMSSLAEYVTNVHCNSNPNTLYLLHGDAAMPEGLDEANVVIGNHAEKIRLHEGWDFLSPLNFTADEVSYQCESVKGKWQTVALPFSPDVVPAGIQLVEFSAVDDGNLPVFTNTCSMLRNVPYAYWSDADASLSFTASNARISSSRNAVMAASADEFRFLGTTAGKRVENVLVLNDEGDAFVRKDGQIRVSPFGAYFMAPENVAEVKLPTMGGDGVIEMASQSDSPSSVYYNLNGQRVDKPQRGIYVKNHKKVMVW